MLYSFVSKFGLLRLVVVAGVLSLGFTIFHTDTSFAAENTKSCTYDYNADKSQIIANNCTSPSPIKDGAGFKRTSLGTPTVYTLKTSKGAGSDFGGGVGALNCTAKITVNKPAAAAAAGTLSGNATLNITTASKCQPVSGAVKIGVLTSNVQLQANEVAKSLVSQVSPALLSLYCSKNQSDTPQQNTACLRTSKATVDQKITKCSNSAYNSTAILQLTAGSTAYQTAVIDCLVKENVGSQASIAAIVTPDVANAALAAAKAAKTDDDPQDDGDGTDETTSCAVDGIGWFICPISNSIAKGVDSIYSLVEYFLNVEPLGFNTDNGLYQAWSAIRNIANVAFVLSFLVIIYSQITGAGLSNYGIKKLLPKLVLVAVLVNVSYILCAVAVDLSNISGNSLQALMMTIRESAASTNPQDIPSWDIFITSVLSGGAIGGLTFVALGAAGSFTALLWLAVPVLIGALFSVLVAVLVLAGRQALIVILITLAPLAFVAYLLPNTSKLFDRWKDIFMNLLVMYPLLSLIFGGSQLAASIIMNNASSTLIVFLALAVQVIPLAITPMVIKLSGGILNRVAGIVNNSQKGLLDKGKNYARERAELATKKGLASQNPNILNRMGKRRDFNARDRKGRDEEYTARANENWLKSTRGLASQKALGDAKHEEETAQTRANAYVAANRSRKSALESRVAKQELDMHNKREDAEFEEVKVGQLDVSGSNLEGLATEARDNLRETNVAASRSTAAGRLQQKEAAEAMTETVTRMDEVTGEDVEIKRASALAQRMGGIDPQGTSRAVASATAALDKQFGENVSAEKTTMSSMSVADLMETMKDTTATSERRAAAAGMVMSRGGDQHVQAALDYLGTTDQTADPSIKDVQKQVAHDLGSRKPFALGETDVSTLANGTYGLDKDGKPAYGSFNDKLLYRIQAGKLGTKELLSMGSDELQRVTQLVASGKLNNAEHLQITEAIDEIYSNENITNPNEEKTKLLNSIRDKQVGELTTLAPLAEATRPVRTYGPNTP